MLQHPDYTRQRIHQLTSRFKNRIYSQTQDIDHILVSPQTDRISYAQAVQLPYAPASIGQTFGPLWASYWFSLQATVPQAWDGQRVDLLWRSHCEATLWQNGLTLQGLNHSANQGVSQDRPDAILLPQAQGGETISFHIEIACNHPFGSWGKPTGPTHRCAQLEQAQIALFNPLAWEIYHDLLILTDLESQQNPTFASWGQTSPGDLDKSWAGHLLSELNRFANLIDEDNPASWPNALPILKSLLATTNGSYSHQLSAIGHAHIDTAWLWPLAETDRKCERTFSTQIAYMNAYPAYQFACSQAYQYTRIQQRNPHLYQQIKSKAASGQWIPVGGTWIEPDCNIPSGESLCRQFLFGQRFFQKEFGQRCKEFWNPDVFGYNGQLPQIMKSAGIQRFLTQKLSWNRFNQPLHHTFTWHGIDGSAILAHFPPSDTYNAEASVSELRKHVRNYKDNNRSSHAIYLFGYGDGGGGPTKTMIETLLRAKNLQGLPQCTLRSPDQFFSLLENNLQDIPHITGELYFELHRGTYTTQAATKKSNRQSEFLLHNLELIYSILHCQANIPYPHAQLSSLWELVLLNQFHDILPGSSITQVYLDAAQQYALVQSQGQALLQQGLQQLASLYPPTIPPTIAPTSTTSPSSNQHCLSFLNSTAADRFDVVQTPDNQLALIQSSPYSLGQLIQSTDSLRLHLPTNPDTPIILENNTLLAHVHPDGRLLSLTHKPTNRQILSAPAGMELYDDRPTDWDAWDTDIFHIETAQPIPPAREYKIITHSPLRIEIQFTGRIGKSSTYEQTIRLDAHSPKLEFHTHVHWQEQHKFLKAAFPVHISSPQATYETCFGAVQRPTHFNDLLALARFEVPGHRWSDLSEHGFGVSLLSDSKYGYSTHHNILRLSLLRAPTWPDPTADQGHHQFAYAIYPHPHSWQQAQTVHHALAFNCPLLPLPHPTPPTTTATKPNPLSPQPFCQVNTPNLILDTIKKAEDSNALILRLYEAHGSRGHAKIKPNFPFQSASFCNILEDDLQPAKITNGEIEIFYTPFQIISLKLG